MLKSLTKLLLLVVSLFGGHCLAVCVSVPVSTGWLDDIETAATATCFLFDPGFYESTAITNQTLWDDKLNADIEFISPMGMATLSISKFSTVTWNVPLSSSFTMKNITLIWNGTANIGINVVGALYLENVRLDFYQVITSSLSSFAGLLFHFVPSASSNLLNVEIYSHSDGHTLIGGDAVIFYSSVLLSGDDSGTTLCLDLNGYGAVFTSDEGYLRLSGCRAQLSSGLIVGGTLVIDLTSSLTIPVFANMVTLLYFNTVQVNGEATTFLQYIFYLAETTVVFEHMNVSSPTVAVELIHAAANSIVIVNDLNLNGGTVTSATLVSLFMSMAELTNWNVSGSHFDGQFLVATESNVVIDVFDGTDVSWNSAPFIEVGGTVVVGPQLCLKSMFVHVDDVVEAPFLNQVTAIHVNLSDSDFTLVTDAVISGFMILDLEIHNSNFVADLPGATADSQALLRVNEFGTLLIKDTSISTNNIPIVWTDSHARVTLASGSSHFTVDGAYTAAFVIMGSSLMVEAVHFTGEGDDNNPLFILDRSATGDFNGTTFQLQTGSLIRVLTSWLTLSDVTMRYCSATNVLVDVSDVLAQIHVTNTLVESCQFSSAFFVSNVDIATFTDLVIVSNTVTAGGGSPLKVSNCDSVSVAFSEFFANKGIGKGGAALMINSQATFTACIFTNNTATGGGALFALGSTIVGSGASSYSDQDQMWSLLVSDSEFSGNAANATDDLVQRSAYPSASVFGGGGGEWEALRERGGAVLVDWQGNATSFLEMSSCTLSNNVAEGGSALFVNCPDHTVCNVILYDLSVKGGLSTMGLGSLSLMSVGMALLTRVSVESNRAGLVHLGAGLHVWSAALLNITDSRFVSNDGMGARFFSVTDANIENVDFSGNTLMAVQFSHAQLAMPSSNCSAYENLLCGIAQCEESLRSNLWMSVENCTVDPCAFFSSMSGCTESSSSTTFSSSSSSSSSTVSSPPSTVLSSSDVSVVLTCTDAPDCSSCIGLSECGWCSEEGTCLSSVGAAGLECPENLATTCGVKLTKKEVAIVAGSLSSIVGLGLACGAFVAWRLFCLRRRKAVETRKAETSYVDDSGAVVHKVTTSSGPRPLSSGAFSSVMTDVSSVGAKGTAADGTAETSSQPPAPSDAVLGGAVHPDLMTRGEFVVPAKHEGVVALSTFAENDDLASRTTVPLAHVHTHAPGRTFEGNADLASKALPSPMTHDQALGPGPTFEGNADLASRTIGH